MIVAPTGVHTFPRSSAASPPRLLTSSPLASVTSVLPSSQLSPSPHFRLLLSLDRIALSNAPLHYLSATSSHSLQNASFVFNQHMRSQALTAVSSLLTVVSSPLTVDLTGSHTRTPAWRNERHSVCLCED